MNAVTNVQSVGIPATMPSFDLFFTMIIEGFETSAKLRLLVLLQGRELSDHPGIADAFSRLLAEQAVDTCQIIPIAGLAAKLTWDGLWPDIAARVEQDAVNAVFLHHFHGKGYQDPTSGLKALRALRRAPLIALSCGDPFSADWMMPNYPLPFRRAAALSDVVFSTQMGSARRKITGWGAPLVMLLPLAACQKRFRPRNPAERNSGFDFDVVIVGNRNSGRFNPLSHYFHASRKRLQVVDSLQQRLGTRLGLFGNGWKGYAGWQGPVPFPQQQDAMARGRVVVDGFPFSHADFYMSNRPFIAIGSGVPVVSFRVPRVNTILREDEHWYLCDDERDLIRVIDGILEAPPEIVLQKSGRAATEVFSRHTQYHRMHYLVQVLQAMHDSRQTGKPPRLERPPFLLSDANVAPEEWMYRA